ncbi:6-phosphofructokinase, alpha subunit [Quaeritorhiza haematococci]|nr:6-phosphofructokinase, alpha subunit [Quaeritorhiza haematococci]
MPPLFPPSPAARLQQIAHFLNPSPTMLSNPSFANALSHVTITVTSPAQVTKLEEFYTGLGFRRISRTPLLTNNQSQNESSEVWLHLFPGLEPSMTAYTSTAASDGDETEELETLEYKALHARAHEGVSLRVVVVQQAQQKGNNSGQVELSEAKAAEILDIAAADSYVSSNPFMVLKIQDVEKVQQNLQKLKAPHKHLPKKPSANANALSGLPVLFALDPVGNIIGFSFMSAFETPKSEQDREREEKKRRVSVTTSTTTLNRSTQNIPGPDSDIFNDTVTSPTELSKAKKRIGILTSGGDSSGMNAAVRAITRISLQRGCVPYAIYEGYEGLVAGGDKIKPLGWEDVRGLLSVGGTVIGTARSMKFRTREGRLDATYNLIVNGIDALIVIGGDGSLTGADKLRSEWKGLVDELIASDLTIGAVTSLHRICEALDSLTSTAMSHQRAFVVEVMGRHCGWLALMAAIAVGADWVFLPERPPPLDSVKYGEDWESEMTERLRKHREMGSRKTIVIVAEGAIDRQLRPIKTDHIKKVIDERLGLDTRVTTLGHIQRGGTPCAFDRYLATLQGIEAVDAVLRSTPETPSPMIGMSQNKITKVPLREAVKLTHAVGEAISKKDFATAMELRDPDFNAAYNAYIESTLLAWGPGARKAPMQLRVGIIHVGAPAGGMNAATRIAARLCLNRGHVPLAIRNGFSGLVKDDVAPLGWREVKNWQVRGGSELGTNRDHPAPLPGHTSATMSHKGRNLVDLGLIAYHLQKHGIQALLLIGGFEAYSSLLTLAQARSVYPAFCIPMVHLPATVSNNVPGTDVSIGTDTALNVIVEACDRIKLSANASRNRVFVVEVQGGSCGYLAVIGGLSVGAMNTYIPEEGITIDGLQRDIRHLCRRYSEDEETGIQYEGRILLRTESASAETYPTEVLSNIVKAEGRGLFDSRTAVLGHLQQGGVPSPLDRIRASRLAVNCVDWLQQAAVESTRNKNGGGEGVKNASTVQPEVYTTKPEHACVIGIRGAQTVFTPVEALLEETDVKHRRPKEGWWMNYVKLIRILAKYEFYEI